MAVGFQGVKAPFLLGYLVGPFSEARPLFFSRLADLNIRLLLEK